MPQVQAAEVVFTLLIGTFMIALMVLSFRETRLRTKERQP